VNVVQLVDQVGMRGKIGAGSPVVVGVFLEEGWVLGEDVGLCGVGRDRTAAD
jgi:hypothetical protein